MSTETQRYSLSGETMGTRYSALFYAEPPVDEDAINKSLFAAVDTVDQQMSTWKAQSALNRLNAAPEQQWLPIPEELATVLATALRVSRQSNGAFDIAVGDLVNAWGFGPDEQHPTAEHIRASDRQVRTPATQALEIDPQRNLARKRSATTLDLSGIAKGFAVDEMARCLDGWGITNYLVGIDGEMRARGVKPDGESWVVAIERPRRGIREVMGVMEICDAAIATSGDYRHWIEVAGRHYSHTMDPALGAPLSNSLAAVTVVAATCMLADAWATAFMVLGETAGPELAQERGMDALFVVHDGEQFREISVVAGCLQAQIEAR
ncbi:thiamine biosynthesis protein ApbE [Pseudomonas frederiksbergensis]|uniref:FAD:protein FMN transferase n=1 Tax=Pseudomonas frederiksbergensis TaxID=104087 RepID=A0A1J0EQR7_9PSED|nr:FAD:protein FMN transferase [Pseudomonas frederiksbergensis]APC18441.1 thiamine biosynthesis protein ApbE [Pseudomonas frederiksbergensis]